MPPEAQIETSTLGDSSGTLFSLYSEIATEEDDKKMEHWQKDADGILVFVSHYVGILTVISINSNTIDRFILYCCRCTSGRVRPRHKTKPPGHLRILSRKSILPSFPHPHEHFDYPFLS